MGYLLLIYIAKHSNFAPHQKNIWVLLTTCPNPHLCPVSLLPSYYLLWPTKYALHWTSRALLFIFYDTWILIGARVALTLSQTGVTWHTESCWICNPTLVEKCSVLSQIKTGRRYLTGLILCLLLEKLLSLKTKLLFIECMSNKVHVPKAKYISACKKQSFLSALY